MDLNNINASAKCEMKEKIKLNQLKLNEIYPIHNMKIIATVYGDTVLVELENNSIFLPKRMTSSIEQNIEKFVPGKYGLIYTGENLVYKQKNYSSFRIVEL